MEETCQIYCEWGGSDWKGNRKRKVRRADPGKMPIYFGVDANCCGVVVPCKGRNCHTLFELKIKEGKQIM